MKPAHIAKAPLTLESWALLFLIGATNESTARLRQPYPPIRFARMCFREWVANARPDLAKEAGWL